MTANRLVRLYYLATPLFMVIDLLWQAPLRVAFLPDRGVRTAFGATDCYDPDRRQSVK